RIVNDRTIAHAIIDSYIVASIKERSPEVHLFIEMPPDAVDVNVHPTKAEVRFRDQSLVHEVVRRALMDALGRSGVPELRLTPEGAGVSEPSAVAIPGGLSGGAFPSRWMPGEVRLQPDPTTEGEMTPSNTQLSDVASGLLAPSKPQGGEGGSRTIGADADIKPLIPLGQFRDTFIIAVDADGI